MCGMMRVVSVKGSRISLDRVRIYQRKDTDRAHDWEVWCRHVSIACSEAMNQGRAREEGHFMTKNLYRSRSAHPTCFSSPPISRYSRG